VLHTTIQVDLVRQSSLGEDLLGLVTLGSWEDLIRFYDPYSADFHLRGSLCVLTGGSNTQWAFDSLQFIRLDKAGMRDESGIQLALLQISDDILSTETVADAPDSFDSHVPSHFLDQSIHDWINTVWQMSRWTI